MHVVRDSQPLFLSLCSRILSHKIFFRQKCNFLGEKTHVAKKATQNCDDDDECRHDDDESEHENNDNKNNTKQYEQEQKSVFCAFVSEEEEEEARVLLCRCSF